MQDSSFILYAKKKIVYSDNDKQFLPIECSSFRQIQINKHSMETYINLSNLSFTGTLMAFLPHLFELHELHFFEYIFLDNCYVKLCIVMYVDEYNDIKKKIYEASENAALCHESFESENLVEKNLRNNFNIIELSQQVKLYFEPLLARKFM